MNWLFLFLFLFIGCGSDNSEKELLSIVDDARMLLSNKECDKAILKLEQAGRSTENAEYMQTLSSAYACKANYSTPKFWSSNLTKINATENGFIGSLTTFTTSPTSSASAEEFVYLQSAIDILLYAGGIASASAENRAEKFAADDAGNINAQLLFMLLSQMGKYFYLYGNADPVNGVKGAGSPANGNDNGDTNTCLYTYTATLALTLINNGTSGSCTQSANVGHPSLTGVIQETRVRRMCQGVILFNNFVDVINNMQVPTNGGSLLTIGDTLETAVDTLCSFGNSSICNMKDISECTTEFASDPGNPATLTGFNVLQNYYAAVFENLFR